MKAEQYVLYNRPEMSEYCPVLIMPDGNIFDCSAGHLQMLRSLSSRDILENMPGDVSPMLYLCSVLHCVLVDYENQIYIDGMTPEQEHALEVLQSAGLICDHRSGLKHEAVKI